MSPIPFETIRQLADELHPYEQAQLIEHLSRRLVTVVRPQPAPIEPPPAVDQAWSKFFAICEDIRKTYPHINLIRRLEEDRKHRDAALWGVYKGYLSEAYV
jgi:hypothetical protein